jgi:hypothetical protein
MGVKTPDYGTIRRRRIVHLAPDMSGFLAAFLRQEAAGGTP